MEKELEIFRQTVKQLEYDTDVVLEAARELLKEANLGRELSQLIKDQVVLGKFSKLGEAIFLIDKARGPLSGQSETSREKIHQLEETINCLKRDRNKFKKTIDDSRLLKEESEQKNEELRKALSDAAGEKLAEQVVVIKETPREREEELSFLKEQIENFKKKFRRVQSLKPV